MTTENFRSADEAQIHALIDDRTKAVRAKDSVGATSSIARDVLTLLVLRHAKSSWNDSAIDDHARPLNKRGRRDGPRMGRLIREHRLTPDIIMSSDAVRARRTAEAVAKAARYAGAILLDRRLYIASPPGIFAVLRTVRETKAGTVMIVGHNPGLEELVTQLTGEQQDLPTAALAQIGLPIGRWRNLKASTRGTLLGLWRPKEQT